MPNIEQTSTQSVSITSRPFPSTALQNNFLTKVHNSYIATSTSSLSLSPSFSFNNKQQQNLKMPPQVALGISTGNLAIAATASSLINVSNNTKAINGSFSVAAAPIATTTNVTVPTSSSSASSSSVASSTGTQALTSLIFF